MRDAFPSLNVSRSRVIWIAAWPISTIYWADEGKRKESTTNVYLEPIPFPAQHSNPVARLNGIESFSQ